MYVKNGNKYKCNFIRTGEFSSVYVKYKLGLPKSPLSREIFSNKTMKVSTYTLFNRRPLRDHTPSCSNCTLEDYNYYVKYCNIISHSIIIGVPWILLMFCKQKRM